IAGFMDKVNNYFLTLFFGCFHLSPPSPEMADPSSQKKAEDDSEPALAGSRGGSGPFLATRLRPAAAGLRRGRPASGRFRLPAKAPARQDGAAGSEPASCRSDGRSGPPSLRCGAAGADPFD